MEPGHSGEEIDQFQLLEEKVDSLIKLVSALKKENGSLSEKLRNQEGRLAQMSERLKKSEAAKDMARERIGALLGKMEQIGI